MRTEQRSESVAFDGKRAPIRRGGMELRQPTRVIHAGEATAKRTCAPLERQARCFKRARTRRFNSLPRTLDTERQA